MVEQKGKSEKVSLHIYVKKELDTEFRQFIAKRYGTIERGLLSHEVEAAMESWIRTHQNTQSTSSSAAIAPNPVHRVHVVREQVKEYLRTELGYFDIHEVPLKHVREAIGVVRGTDSRTIKKWMEDFDRYKIIKWMSPKVVEFL